jgi:DinB superfamily
MPTIPELIDIYATGPAKLRAATANMTREQLLARPVAGKWSTLEVVAHIADFEPVLVDRMKRIACFSKPLLFVADENEFVKLLAYQERDLEEELHVIESTRASMARVLRTFPAETFARHGVHTEKGLVTLEQILTAAGNHIPNHLPFIHAKREALGLS